MSEKVLVTKSSMDAIGDSIRDRNGLATEYLPSEMPAAIEAIPNSYTISDEGKIVKNGALVAQTARATEIIQNGTYDTTDNNSVTVNVSGGGGAVVQPLSVTQNGAYNPPSGVDGYAPVTVNVSGGGSEYIEEWDLSQSLAGELHGISINAYNTAVSSAGVVFDSTYDYLLIPMSWDGITIEVDVATMNLTSGSHRRFIMSNSECGLIYRSSGVWGFYSSSGWAQDSGETDGSFFNGSTIKIAVDNNGYWHIYKDGILWWEPNKALIMSGSSRQIRIGSDSMSINNAIITGVRLL